jgi:hypothetical protein
LVDYDKPTAEEHLNERKVQIKKALGIIMRRTKEHEVYEKELNKPKTLKRDKKGLM